MLVPGDQAPHTRALLAGALLIVAGYAMDLYCRYGPQTLTLETALAHKWRDTELVKGGGELINGEGVAQLVGETFADCKKQARQLGWVFGRDGDVTCPICSKKGVK